MRRHNGMRTSYIISRKREKKNPHTLTKDKHCNGVAICNHCWYTFFSFVRLNLLRMAFAISSLSDIKEKLPLATEFYSAKITKDCEEWIIEQLNVIFESMCKNHQTGSCRFKMPNRHDYADDEVLRILVYDLKYDVRQVAVSFSSLDYEIKWPTNLRPLTLEEEKWIQAAKEEVAGLFKDDTKEVQYKMEAPCERVGWELFQQLGDLYSHVKFAAYGGGCVTGVFKIHVKIIKKEI